MATEINLVVILVREHHSRKRPAGRGRTLTAVQVDLQAARPNRELGQRPASHERLQQPDAPQALGARRRLT